MLSDGGDLSTNKLAFSGLFPRIGRPNVCFVFFPVRPVTMSLSALLQMVCNFSGVGVRIGVWNP